MVKFHTIVQTSLEMAGRVTVESEQDDCMPPVWELGNCTLGYSPASCSTGYIGIATVSNGMSRDICCPEYVICIIFHVLFRLIHKKEG
jgi:hypothetical protein